MRIIHALAPLALIFTVPAAAQQSPPPARAPVPVTRIEGQIVSITDASMTLRTADGKTTTYALSPNWTLFTSRSVPASTIKPGDFVATTNINIDGSTGRATELRLYPPSMGAGRASSYPMAEPNTTMTNAPVAEVADNKDGRFLTVTLSGSQRRILLPPGLHVLSNGPLDKSALKPGWRVAAMARPDGKGGMTLGTVTTGENGAAPPKP